MRSTTIIGRVLLIAILILLIDRGINAQSLENFKEKYGQPTQTQFLIRPDMVMDVYTAENGNICRLSYAVSKTA